ncbi:hypothetical protein OG897_00675 [Streptomyces sp. NBC_00237]|uniref:hypothetical protein n=1 Tax=Streptomyces sp. NBC_00237 TaxID=2975687 RepID=UPI00224EB5F0|nr:hypothetical protein [Streptomyces sp. NBC_00237]MCX5199979.1 hypothetical protein [Streptomyces sp. NBC_00237]
MSQPIASPGAYDRVAPRLARAAVFAAVCVVLSAIGHVLGSTATVPWWTLAVGFAGLFALAAPLAGRTRSLPGITFAMTAGQLALHALFGLGQSHAGTVQGDGEGPLSALAAQLMCGGGTGMSDAQARNVLATAGIDPTAGAHSAHGAGTSTESYVGYGAVGTGGGQDSGAAAADCLHSLVPSLPMLLGHLLAALATGWLLRHGDLALRRLARLSAYGAQEVATGALVRALRAAFALVRALWAGLSGAPSCGPVTVPAPFLVPVRAGEEDLQHSVIRRGPPATAFFLAA